MVFDPDETDGRKLYRQRADRLASTQVNIAERNVRLHAGLTDTERKAQAARCPCRGADDWCVCQNVPDAVTRKERAA